ncbi:MAG: AraC family transcriptional regulator [Parabacteroides sp.]|nr:AraC family transcriptional regulator [Parabacteroides sp.]
MNAIPRYRFYKTKYGEELLIDVVTLDGIKRYITEHPVHTLSYFDITFITGGSGGFSIDGTPYLLEPGDVIFSRPNEVRAWDKTCLPQGYALLFEEEFLLSFFNDRSFIRNLSYFNRDRTSAKINIRDIYPRIEGLLQHLISEINNRESKDKHILRAQLYEMLMLLNREYSKHEPVTSERLPDSYTDSFIRLVDKNFKHHHDTRYYADTLCITPNYLNEAVHKSIGMSPKRYIQDKIIREAKILLSYTQLSVAEIADELNFENHSYFIRLFRRQTTLTPLQYRRSVNR